MHCKRCSVWLVHIIIWACVFLCTDLCFNGIFVQHFDLRNKSRLFSSIFRFAWLLSVQTSVTFRKTRSKEPLEMLKTTICVIVYYSGFILYCLLLQHPLALCGCRRTKTHFILNRRLKKLKGKYSASSV